MAVIKLENLSKVYDMGEDNKVYALQALSFEIQKGEFVAIVGPSGSGKSTLMHIIGLLDAPTAGKIFLEGRDVSSLSANAKAQMRNKHIGFVFQVFNLLPRTSALENVEMPLVYAGIGKNERDEMAKKTLEGVGLGDRLNHAPNQLSGGQQQRVAIARALINNPSLILADEPTGNLDSRSGEEILHILSDLNKKGHTIVLVTHDMTIAKKAKRIIEIKDGKVIKDQKN
jgi:putative ABC transport system ATP-binding protein